MKRCLFAIICLVWSMCLYAQQEWAPVGATWYVNCLMRSHNPPLGCYYTIESREVIVDGVSYRQLGDDLTKQIGDEVYVLLNDTLRLTYKFDVMPGDTVTFTFNASDDDYMDSVRLQSITYVVEVVDTLIVDGVPLKRVTCWTSSDNGSFQTPEYTYLERLGDVRRMPVESCACPVQPSGEWYWEWLRCYTDGDINFHSERFSEYGDLDCDYVQTSSTEAPEPEALSTAPHPVRGDFRILGLQSQGDIMIFNAAGVPVLNTTIGPGATISTSGWPSGLYLIHLKTNQAINTLKMVVE